MYKDNNVTDGMLLRLCPYSLYRRSGESDVSIVEESPVKPSSGKINSQRCSWMNLYTFVQPLGHIGLWHLKGLAVQLLLIIIHWYLSIDGLIVSLADVRRSPRIKSLTRRHSSVFYSSSQPRSRNLDRVLSSSQLCSSEGRTGEQR